MLRRLARIALWVISGFVVGSILLVALYRYLPPPGTPLMLLRRVEGYGIHKSWISFDQISANLVRAVIASEDLDFATTTVSIGTRSRRPGIATGVDAAVC